jgi:hypothetical protein
MVIIGILFVSVMFSTTPKQDEAAQRAAVKKLAMELGDATMKGDSAKVIDHTYPGIIKESGGREKAIAGADSVQKLMKARGVTFKEFKVDEPGEFLTEGDNTFVVVPTAATLTSPMGTVRLKSYLLGISSDGGKTWTFADGAGVQKEEIRDRVLPKLPAKLKLPALGKPEFVKD